MRAGFSPSVCGNLTDPAGKKLFEPLHDDIDRNIISSKRIQAPGGSKPPCRHLRMRKTMTLLCGENLRTFQGKSRLFKRKAGATLDETIGAIGATWLGSIQIGPTKDFYFLR
jgi:hypothetical protein